MALLQIVRAQAFCVETRTRLGHFDHEAILWAVRWYCQYGVSYREWEEVLSERGVVVDHSTIYRGVQRYAPILQERLKW